MTKPQTADEIAAGDSTWDQWTLAHAESLALAIVALGFLLRVREAWGTFLNPDEALHFFIANRASLGAVYVASLTQAHPPLLFFLLYGLRSFGGSEFVLRLPTVLTGTLFCWIFFKWLARIFGTPIGLTGLVFATLLPPMINVTAQVRQYGLLLVFLISGAWFLEIALDKESPRLMLISALFLWLAVLSHYSAFLFVAVIGVYALLRMWNRRVSLPSAIAWTCGQLVACALAVCLYLTHISRIKGTTMAEQAFDGWLKKSYFHHGMDNPLTFLVTRSFSLFQYIFGQLIVGDIVSLLFVAGIIFLVRGKIRSAQAQRSTLAVLLLLPFALNYALALFDVYPFGGTRHCIYLSIFAFAAVAVCVARIARQRAAFSIALAAFLVVFCFIFRTNHAPYIARADQSLAHMDHAVGFVREQIPASDLILTDYESAMELGHYLCEQKSISNDGSIPGFLVFHCGGHRVISTIPDVWAFTPELFFDQWQNLMRSGRLSSGQPIWVIQAGWMVKLDEDLRKQFPDFRDLKTQAFGNNIRFFRLTAGEAVPANDAPK
jgi:hypothetical protein